MKEAIKKSLINLRIRKFVFTSSLHTQIFLKRLKIVCITLFCFTEDVCFIIDNQLCIFLLKFIGDARLLFGI